MRYSEHYPAATEAFWERVELRGDNECWPWTGHVNPAGYGLLVRNGRNMRAHRFSYELLVGDIPDGLVLDHICHDPKTCVSGFECPHRSCVNPAHVKPVTRKENLASDRTRSAHREMTHCKRGHEFDEANTRWTYKASKDSWGRTCRACVREGAKKLEAERKVAA